MLHPGAALIRWVVTLGLLATGLSACATAPGALAWSTQSVTVAERFAGRADAVSTPSWQPLLPDARALTPDSAPPTRVRLDDLATVLGAWLPNGSPRPSLVPGQGGAGAQAILYHSASSWELLGRTLLGAVPPVALSLLFVVGLRWARSLRGPPAQGLAFRGLVSDLG